MEDFFNRYEALKQAHEEETLKLLAAYQAVISYNLEMLSNLQSRPEQLNYYSNEGLQELVHSLVARRRGLPVKNITLFIFGGVSNIERELKSPGIEFQIAFVGPFTNLVSGIVCFVILLPLNGSNSPAEGILFYLAVTNILLGIFNLIPGFPLDSGRVLHSIVWKLTGNMYQATRVAA